MSDEIIVYGLGDKSELGFENEIALRNYLKSGLFEKQDRRFRYTQNKRAGIIVLSRDGFALGHLVIEKSVEPTLQDIDSYPPVKRVYIVDSTAIYENAVKLSELGIFGIAYGKSLTSPQLDEIKSRAGRITNYYPTTHTREPCSLFRIYSSRGA